MRMTRFLGLLLAIFIPLLSGCTDQMIAKTWGGDSTQYIACDHKLVMPTWKASNLWFAVQSMEEGYVPQTTIFYESASWGIFEGTITIIEETCEQKTERERIAAEERKARQQSKPGGHRGRNHPSTPNEAEAEDTSDT